MDRRNFLMAGSALLGRLALPGGMVAIAGCSGSTNVPGTLVLGGTTMGTTYSVRLGAGLDPQRRDVIDDAIRLALSAVDKRMSTYDPDSELSRFNQTPDTGWQRLSADTLAVLSHARRTSEDSGGAFDASVGPLVNLWGFGPDGTLNQAPATRDVSVMLERVGWRHVEIDERAGTVRKTRADAYLDLSGIAKGHGVDSVAQVLDAHGIGDYLVEVGGELAARGTRPGGDAWRVAIEQPLVGNRRVQRLVDLKGRAIATSGDYRIFFDDRGRHYSHTIDPRDGRPVAHGLASVSVIADSAAAADAASTALMVMGAETGLAWAREHRVAALFVQRDGERLRESASPALDPHMLG